LHPEIKTRSILAVDSGLKKKKSIKIFLDTYFNLLTFATRFEKTSSFFKCNVLRVMKVTHLFKSINIYKKIFILLRSLKVWK
jgi:hypothetical protein